MNYTVKFFINDVEVPPLGEVSVVLPQSAESVLQNFTIDMDRVKIALGERTAVEKVSRNWYFSFRNIKCYRLCFFATQ